MKYRFVLGAAPLVALASCATGSGSVASEGAQSMAADYQSFDQSFVESVQPVVNGYCTGCHGGERPRAMLDLTAFENTAQVVAAMDVWDHVRQRVEAGEMPPEGRPQPSAEERQEVIGWIESLSDYEAQRNSGDLNPVR